MKYWWLEKYRDFKIIQIKELQDDINYFLTVPKNYKKQYEALKDKDVNLLEEEDLLIILKKIVDTKNIKDNSLNIIIEKLLQLPDNSFPASDYTLQEMLMEIKGLKSNLPVQSKIENNNLAICYHCLNIFYVDKIKNVNKKNLCLCPYCLRTTLYFDNDYIPMNYTFIKLASLYYGISSLGCSFKEMQKIIKKSVTVIASKEKKDSIEFNKIFDGRKIIPLDEKKIYRKLYQEFMKKEKEVAYFARIYVSSLSKNNSTLLLEILLVGMLEVLSNAIYLKEIQVIFEKEEDKRIFASLLKGIQKKY